MQFKFVVVAFLAVFATQCQASEYPISADKVELRVFVENGAIIAKTLFKTLNSGLDQIKPNVDKILNELEPSAKAFIRKYIDEARAKINEEDKRITQIFATLTKALDTLKNIKPCSDKVSAPAKKLALATEKEIISIITKVQTKYKKEIDNIKLGVKKTVEKARKLFDTEVDAVVKCLTPGRKDAKACLDKEIDKVTKGVTDIVFDAFVILQTAADTLSPVASEILEKIIPLAEKVVKDGRVLLNTLADCVAAMK